MELLDEKEAAKRLRVSPAAMRYRRQHGGGPPFVQNGRLIFYRRADLEAWIEANIRTTARPQTGKAA